MSLLGVQDLVVYQAFVNIISDLAYPSLVTHENQHVFGNLYAGPGKRWMLQRWKQQYSRFVNRIQNLYSDGNPWIASTDIVAFYDTIDHERLYSLVVRHCGDNPRFMSMFRQCLSKWSAHNGSVAMSRGIPQGSNASDFLANLFLYDIDREMIVNGYHYVRYVDDVRILGPDKPSVQRGLILFDLELKRAGLVAQVSKTSVHQIENIEEEINQLRFVITDPSDSGDYILITLPVDPKSEQAASVAEYINETTGDETQGYADVGSDSDFVYENESDSDLPVSNPETSLENYNNLQAQLIEKFRETYHELDDPGRSKEAESNLTFCLYRLEPHEAIREEILSLLPRLPWRSEPITKCLARYKGDLVVSAGLERFISEHNVYSWHLSNALWALYQVRGAKYVKDICREWLSNAQFDWYARTVAARILSEVPGQHAFFVECLQREQATKNQEPEDTAILRHQLAFGAFQRIRAFSKQLATLNLISHDRSRLVRRLIIYLLQQPECKVKWDDLSACHEQLNELSDIVQVLGLAANAPRQCFIFETLSSIYDAHLARNDLRPFYKQHYEPAVKRLRESVIAYHRSPNDYIRTFHQFIHLTLIAFYEYKLPSEGGLYEGYASLTDRRVLAMYLPRSLDSWKRLGRLRNRVDHPVDKATQSHSQRITVKEAEDTQKEFRVAIQELCDSWLDPLCEQ